jgi:hypothetical protein
MYNTDFFNPPSGETLAQALMGVPANYDLVADSSACPKSNPELLINPTDPSESLVIKKITDTQACGVKMPNSSTPLTQDQINCFVSWVNASTANSSGAGGSNSGGAGSGGRSSIGGTSPRSSTSSGGRSGSGGASSRGGTGTGGKAGTGGSASTTVSGIAPTFDTVKLVFTQNVTPCVGSDCHGGHAGRLNLLVDSGLLSRLKSSNSQICNMPVVDPGNASNSALVKVMREGCGNVTPNCAIGSQCIPRMPLNCEEGVDCIPEDYIQAIEQWIANGANP